MSSSGGGDRDVARLLRGRQQDDLVSDPRFNDLALPARLSFAQRSISARPPRAIALAGSPLSDAKTRGQMDVVANPIDTRTRKLPAKALRNASRFALIAIADQNGEAIASKCCDFIAGSAPAGLPGTNAATQHA